MPGKFFIMKVKEIFKAKFRDLNLNLDSLKSIKLVSEVRLLHGNLKSNHMRDKLLN